MKTPSLKKDSFYSLLISVLPALIGLISIPLLIHNIGLERFSFLSISWALIGHFGILDLGISRSLNKRAAKRHSKAEYELLADEIGFGLLLVLPLALFVTLTIMIWGGNAVNSYFHISPELFPETSASVIALGLSIPFVMLNACLKGTLEGLHEFREANKIQLASGIANFIIPSAISVFTPHLGWIFVSLLVFRTGLFLFSWKAVKNRLNVRWPARKDLSLLTEGGWITTAGIASPLMIYADRFILGPFIALREIAFYSTPVDLISRVWIIPQGITRVTFSTFSYLESKKEELEKNFSQALEMMILLCWPICLFVFLFSYEILYYWINPEMADKGSEVLKILVLGFFCNCLGWVTQSLLQATQGIRFVALVSLFEVPVYLATSYFLISKFGYLGAAFAWSGRLVFDVMLVDLYFFKNYKFLMVSLKRKIFVSTAFLLLCGISWEIPQDYRYPWALALLLMYVYYCFKQPIVKQLYLRFVKRKLL